MAVYRLDIAYDGSGFHGYARQPGLRTVQEDLEVALSVYLKTSVRTTVAGRTDAGVHALGQVVSFDHHSGLELDPMLRSLNGIIGPEITIHGASVAADDFDARHSATWRRYRYAMETNRFPNPLTRTTTWHVGDLLDHGSMMRAATAFVGEHDFGAFCRAAPGKSSVRHLSELSLVERDETLEIWAHANAFCHQMVRSIVGYLYDVGRGYADGSRVEEVIASADRSNVGTVAPARGLTLWAVGYPS